MLNDYQNRAAGAIRATLALRRIKQRGIAEKLGLNYFYFNAYLNRKIDLTPDQIETILKELGISDEFISKAKADHPVS